MDFKIIDEQQKLKSALYGLYNEMNSLGIHDIEEVGEFGQIVLAIGKHNAKDIQVQTDMGIAVPTFQDTYVRIKIFRDELLLENISKMEDYLEEGINEIEYKEELDLMKIKVNNRIEELQSKVYRSI